MSPSPLVGIPTETSGHAPRVCFVFRKLSESEVIALDPRRQLSLEAEVA